MTHALPISLTAQSCSECKLKGANLGCVQKGCNQTFHYICAKEGGCELDEESFSMFCQNHKVNGDDCPSFDYQSLTRFSLSRLENRNRSTLSQATSSLRSVP